MYVFLYMFRYICLLIFVCMYVQVPKFHVRAFIFGVFVFIHLCLLYSLTTRIYVSNMFYYDIYYNDVNHSPPLSCIVICF